MIRYAVASFLVLLVMFMIGAIILKTYYLLYSSVSNRIPCYEPRDWFDSDDSMTDEELVRMFSTRDIEILDRYFEEWE